MVAQDVINVAGLWMEGWACSPGSSHPSQCLPPPIPRPLCLFPMPSSTSVPLPLPGTWQTTGLGWETMDAPALVMLGPLPTHRFQVLLQNVPGGLHDLEHHVVLDILHEVEHALAQREGTGEPGHALGSAAAPAYGCPDVLPV